MSLAAFFFFLAGAMGEMALLWNAARRGGSRLAGRFLAFPIAIERLLPLGLVALAWMISLVLGWLRIGETTVSLDDAWVGIIFTLLGLFLLGAGVIGDALLPRVNERTVLSVQILVALFSLTSTNQLAWPALLALVGLPLLASLALAVSRRELAPMAQALVYLGYLLALLALTWQTARVDYFNAPTLDNWQALAFGGLFVFLLLHVLFAVRFILIVSSFILARNRVFAGLIMPRLYSNEQVSPLAAGVFTGLLAVGVLLNARFGWVSPAMLASLAVMLSAQGMGIRWKGRTYGV